MFVNVMSRNNAIRYSDICTEDIIIVSISTPFDTLPVFKNNSHIKGIHRMSFYDVINDEPNFKAPKPSDFVGLKKFIDTHKNKIDGIIVHCDAGISRSAGCAKAIAEYLGCENIVKTQGDKYRPNHTVYTCTQKELGIYYDYAKNSIFNEM